MSLSILITGGARSGKSKFAEQRALEISDRPIYIATAEVRDDEMAERVRRHQERRGDGWDFVHAPLALPDALEASDGAAARLVDCLTLWASNMLLAEADWEGRLEELVRVIESQESPVIFVTNEVGLGIVPDNVLSRQFRDMSGVINQAVAQAVVEVHFVVSGYPMKVK